MSKLLLALLLLAACSNDAITYAHALVPEAKCQSLTTDGYAHVATCTIPRNGGQPEQQWYCAADVRVRPPGVQGYCRVLGEQIRFVREPAPAPGSPTRFPPIVEVSK